MRSRRCAEAGWSRNKALVILAAVTVALAIMSEVLTRAIEPASESLHLSPIFSGVFLLALVGNAAELFNAVRFARKDQMDLCIGITVGASAQVGLLVAPVLVFLGMIIGPGHGPDLLPARADRDRAGGVCDAEPDLRRRVELAGRLDPRSASTSCSASRSCTTPGPSRPTRWRRPRPPRPARDRVGSASTKRRQSAASLTGNLMLGWLEFAFGLLIWLGVIWDGFATIVLPRTVAPMKRLSGRFNRWSWRLWAAAGRRISPPDRAADLPGHLRPDLGHGPARHLGRADDPRVRDDLPGLGPRFQADRGPLGFGALLYMSASTFLTLGLGDITSTDPIARFFIILEAGTGYVFLGLIITYMPVLEQAYGSREVGNLLIHSRAGHPPGAIKFLHRYSSPDRQEILRGILREGERWMAEILQSHLSHPVLVVLPGAALGPIVAGLPDDRSSIAAPC